MVKFLYKTCIAKEQDFLLKKTLNDVAFCLIERKKKDIKREYTET